MDSGVGQTIRDARVRNSITIEKLSSVTKISPPILRAMEAEDLDRLPGGVFTRGFFRSYAREVGLDPEETVAMYVAQLGGAHARSAAEESDAAATAESSVEPDEASGASERSSDLAQMILIAIIVATVGYLGLHNHPEQTVAASTPAPIAREVPVGTSGTLEATTSTAPRTPELRLEIQAIGPCWMAATADGAPVAARLMDAGDSQIVAAHDEIRLRLGDPASVSFSLNGVAGKSLGDSGQAVSIRITPQNLHEFQAK
ncbi:MAG TPA: RodZ domain-containing protein [Vicinamibacterales bacterium]|nr:RodZ domain-containing protein [Vicinamibacterales bacterium]